MFCIAFLVRTYIGAPLVGFLVPRLVGGRLHGTARGVAVTVLSVAVTSPVTSAIVALLFTDVDDFANTYIAALSTTMPMTMIASYFIVGPIAKLLFHNRISPAGGLQLLKHLEQSDTPLLRLFGM